MGNHTTGYPYNGILFDNKKGQQTDTRSWIDLKNIMLSERRQTQKNTFYIIPFTRNSKTGKTNL